MTKPNIHAIANADAHAPSGGLQATTHHVASPTLCAYPAPSLALARSLPLSPEELANAAPLDLFIGQMSTDSSEAKVDAVKRLGTVAAAIGRDKTLNELLPWIADNITGVASPSPSTEGEGGAMDEDAEDEILLVLADRLGSLVPSLIPGSRALPLLPILERLCCVEETVVREKAVESVRRIVPLLVPAKDWTEDDRKTAAGAPSVLLSMAKRLAGADWFTSKVSTAGILPVIYRYYNDHNYNPDTSGDTPPTEGGSRDDEILRELRSLYRDLCEDDAPMVRRAAGRNLGAFAEAVAALPGTAKELYLHPEKCRSATSDHRNRDAVMEEVVPLFRRLSGDEQDSVRLLAVVGGGGVGCALGMNPGLTSELVFPVVRAGCTDLSW